MVLLMGAVYAGFLRQETGYIDSIDADLVVSQAGVTTMQMSLSVVPTGTAAAVAATPGVAWVEELRQISWTVEADGKQLVAYVFGFAPETNRGGPQHLVAGRLPADGEAVLDDGAARQLGVSVGDSVLVFGTPLTISGLTHGLTSVSNTAVFLTSAEFARLAGPGTNYVLAGLAPGTERDEVAALVAARTDGVTVQTRDQFASEQRRFVRDLYAEVVYTMILLGFAVALALVALTLSSITSSKARDFAVMKALGATRTSLVGAVATQALWSVGVAFALATIAAWLLASLFAVAVPNVMLVLEPGAVLWTLVGATAVGAPGALLPLRRVLRVDPATAFRAPAF